MTLWLEQNDTEFYTKNNVSWLAFKAETMIFITIAIYHIYVLS